MNKETQKFLENKELSSAILAEIDNNKLTAKTYSDIFSMMYFTEATDKEKISYCKQKSAWERDSSTYSDMKVLSALGITCEVVRQSIKEQWESSVFSSLVSPSVYKEIEEQMNKLESTESIMTILGLAKEAMVSTDDSGRYNWGAGKEDTATEEPSQDFPTSI